MEESFQSELAELRKCAKSGLESMRTELEELRTEQKERKVEQAELAGADICRSVELQAFAEQMTAIKAERADLVQLHESESAAREEKLNELRSALDHQAASHRSGLADLERELSKVSEKASAQLSKSLSSDTLPIAADCAAPEQGIDTALEVDSPAPPPDHSARSPSLRETSDSSLRRQQQHSAAQITALAGSQSVQHLGEVAASLPTAASAADLRRERVERMSSCPSNLSASVCSLEAIRQSSPPRPSPRVVPAMSSAPPFASALQHQVATSSRVQPPQGSASPSAPGIRAAALPMWGAAPKAVAWQASTTGVTGMRHPVGSPRHYGVS
eukprot:gnl/TRDRNA2_/TRDRNA2_87930_c1_seq2.p1 gnl/TRDRNA2_/TRDRNA2_87930_c1~~gnl/TRDRNA2_/TRDRNA2_87930_c1_seq2.p1  ORF type:complete len:330 (-),score=66.94 gnl/TRDRNA2_/TRDRNA2_87930_c1_seq2:86-1075(-)